VLTTIALGAFSCGLARSLTLPEAHEEDLRGELLLSVTLRACSCGLARSLTLP